MKNFPSLLFFQFYRYSDELIEQSELERVFTMSTTKGATQDLTFTTATNVTGSTFCTGRIVRFPRRQDPQTLIQQGGICCPFAENFSLTVKLPLSPMNSTQFRSSRLFCQKQIPSSIRLIESHPMTRQKLLSFGCRNPKEPGVFSFLPICSPNHKNKK